MRVNVYHEELTREVEIVPVEPRPGKRYIGLRFLLESSPKLHDSLEDDDRSAVTLWIGSPEEGVALLEHALDGLEAWQRGDWLAKEPRSRHDRGIVGMAAENETAAPIERRGR